METLQIEIINPKAKLLLKSLADMDLIIIKKRPKESGFNDLLSKLRKNAENAPSLEEITKEVESVRQTRYEQEKSNSWYKSLD